MLDIGPAGFAHRAQVETVSGSEKLSLFFTEEIALRSIRDVRRMPIVLALCTKDRLGHHGFEIFHCHWLFLRCIGLSTETRCRPISPQLVCQNTTVFQPSLTYRRKLKSPDVPASAWSFLSRTPQDSTLSFAPKTSAQPQEAPCTTSRTAL